MRTAALSKLKIEPKKDKNIRKIKLKSPVGNKRVNTLIKDRVSKKILNQLYHLIQVLKSSVSNGLFPLLFRWYHVQKIFL